MTDTPAAVPVPAPRDLGPLLTDSFAVLRGGLPDYAAILAVAVVPSVSLMALALMVAGLTDKESVEALKTTGSLASLVPVALAGLASAVLQGLGFVALVFSTAARAAGQSLAWDESYRRALKRFWPFAWTSILMGLFVFLGLLLLVVPGIVLAVRYSFAHLAAILEERQGLDALGRSKAVVAGRAWKVVGNMLAATVVVALASLAAGGLVSLVLYLPKSFLPGGQSFVALQLESLAQEFVGGLVRVWVIAFSVLLFKDLAVSPQSQG